MKARELIDQLTESDNITILKLLGAKDFRETDEAIITNTVCHHGNSLKLYYYKESKMYHCYTDCGENFNVIELVRRSKKYEHHSTAIEWITTQLGIDTFTYGFSNEPKNNLINDWDFIDSYINRKKKKDKQKIKLPIIDKRILNVFQNMYWKDWIDDNISIQSMKKYNIRYSTLYQKVIIPHYDIDGNLIGIRGRATDDEEADIFGKYTPFMWNDKMYNHPLSQNLYGLHINKETIKRKKKVMLCESEKAVLQCDTIFGEDNFTLALCGNVLSDYQRDVLLSLGVEEVIIGLDRQYKEVNDIEYQKWASHIRKKIISKLAPYVRVYVIWDTKGL